MEDIAWIGDSTRGMGKRLHYDPLEFISIIHFYFYFYFFLLLLDICFPYIGWSSVVICYSCLYVILHFHPSLPYYGGTLNPLFKLILYLAIISISCVLFYSLCFVWPILSSNLCFYQFITFHKASVFVTVPLLCWNTTIKPICEMKLFIGGLLRVLEK